MCLMQDLFNRKDVLKLKINSIWNKIHKFLPPNFNLKLSLAGPLATVRGHGSVMFSRSYQLPETCVHLAQSAFDVSEIIRIERN